ncbi:MAG: S8 family serine peptidase [Ignavibacteria bacterium]|nr:S8 family serine peptidase [Ignavibacteria bacterium]
MKLENKIINKLKRSILLLSIMVFSLTLISFNSENKIFNKENSLYKVFYDKGHNTEKDLPDWALLDPYEDGYEGVRTNEFYKYLSTLSNVPERTEVVVAVIDSGFDTEHPDLKDNIWNNEKEINGLKDIDDDENGYTDDFYGWNFLGDKNEAAFEVTREYYRLKKLNVSEKDTYFQKVKTEFESKKDETYTTFQGIDETLNEYLNAEKILKEKNITSDPKKLMEISIKLKGKYQDAASMILGIYMLFNMDKNDLTELKEEYKTKMNVLFDSTDVSTLENIPETNYGNNIVIEKKESHGTHVSGIISSMKTGQAPFAKIMCLRAVPNEGDEKDKDVGNAIRYAVDNGAGIINMSAGKYFSPDPEFVVDAIKYAEDKGVLFVVSAGNEGEDMADIVNYPRKYLSDNGIKKYFSNMIVVGASSWMKQWNNEKDPENQNSRYDLAAPFSNYSKEVVDIFAPGVQINSTIPNNKYKYESGTSMAAPVVTGVAAVLKSYFPQLTAAQLKDIILSSSRQYEGLKVKIKDKSAKELFSNLSKSGGVVDLINAYKKAVEMTAIQN